MCAAGRISRRGSRSLTLGKRWYLSVCQSVFKRKPFANPSVISNGCDQDAEDAPFWDADFHVDAARCRRSDLTSSSSWVISRLRSGLNWAKLERQYVTTSRRKTTSHNCLGQPAISRSKRTVAAVLFTSPSLRVCFTDAQHQKKLVLLSLMLGRFFVTSIMVIPGTAQHRPQQQ